MSGKGQHSSSHSRRDEFSEQAAALESFVRLRQSQEDFLHWLETSEKKPEVDRYIYKKIR